MAVKRLRERQAEATRDTIVAVARELFTEHGYAGTSIEEIARRAGVAKGALYHHFAGKDRLFRAVYKAVQAETMTAVMAAASTKTSAWEAVHAGLSAFLDACLDPTFRRVVVLESVTVLQHDDDWDGGIDRVELPILRSVLVPLVDDQHLDGVAADPLAHIALGALYGAALYIARASDPAAARAEVDVVLDTVIIGLRGVTGAAASSDTEGE